jgi:hypothetical protein
MRPLYGGAKGDGTMMWVQVILLILAIVCFVLSAFNVQARQGNLLAAGLAFWALEVLIALH